jgi:hypothetical protein
LSQSKNNLSTIEQIHKMTKENIIVYNSQVEDLTKELQSQKINSSNLKKTKEIEIANLIKK